VAVCFSIKLFLVVGPQIPLLLLLLKTILGLQNWELALDSCAIDSNAQNEYLTVGEAPSELNQDELALELESDEGRMSSGLF